VAAGVAQVGPLKLTFRAVPLVSLLPLTERLVALVLLAGVGACATVTQEDPPSLLAGAGGSTGGTASGAGGGAGTAPIADMPAPAGRPMSPGGAIQGEGLAPMTPPPAAAGSGGGAAVQPQDAGPPPALQENFENFAASSANWVPSTGSTWEVRTDAELASNVYTQTETMSSGPHLVVAGNAAWRDVVVEADVRIIDFNGSSSSYMAGLCVRVQDAESFYLVGVRSNDGKLGLRRYADGGTNLVQSEYEDGAEGVWYHLRVEAIGAQITAYLDGDLMFSETDATLENGGIALCTVRASASFDNVSVTAP
jgi:hypothetical protein